MCWKSVLVQGTKGFQYALILDFMFFFSRDLNFNQSEQRLFFFSLCWFACESITRECQDLNFKTVQYFRLIWAKLPQGQKKGDDSGGGGGVGLSSVSFCLSILAAFMYIWEGCHCILKLKSRAARLTRIRHSALFFSRLPGFQLLHKSKAVTCFSWRQLPSKPARLLVQLRLLRPPVWAARSPLNSNYLHLSPPPPSKLLYSWRCASSRSGGVSYQIFIFPFLGH